MDRLKERNRGPRSLENTKKIVTVSASDDEKITTAMDDPRTGSRYPSISHQSNLKQNAASELNMTYRSSELRTASYSDRQDSEYDMASLAFTESDDGATDSSDDSYISQSRTSEKRRRTRRKQNECSTKNEIDSYTNAKPAEQCEVGKYMAAREMSPFQERMNALTILPSTYYCIMFFLSGSWLSKSFIEAYAHEMIDDNEFDNSQCITWSWLPRMHALPPLPPLAAAIGILCHAPFSMIYHWKYAHRLPPGLARTTHWSRRMDQVMIHFCSACMSYATSGRLDFFLVNALFNMDCIYRQFLQEVRPRRNQTLIGISIVAYTIPLLERGEFLVCLKLVTLFSAGGWLFGQYPIGGWSHSVFHIVMALVPPIMMTAALDLSSSQSQLEVAAHCALLAEKTLVS